MELSTGQQRLLFAVIVVLLAGLGIYLIGPGTHRGNAASPSTSPSSSPGSTPAVAPSSPATATPPATLPPFTGAPPSSSAGGANIYEWLPFTQQDLTEAAQATTTFATDYETFTYTETAPVYAAKLSSVATAGLVGMLENTYATPAVAAQRSAQRQISTSSGGIVAIRSFDSDQIIFLVNIVQRLATTKQTTTTTTEYAVTVEPVGGGWQVNDIELQNAGNT